jgi:hypothetical protein
LTAVNRAKGERAMKEKNKWKEGFSKAYRKTLNKLKQTMELVAEKQQADDILEILVELQSNVEKLDSTLLKHGTKIDNLFQSPKLLELAERTPIQFSPLPTAHDLQQIIATAIGPMVEELQGLKTSIKTSSQTVVSEPIRVDVLSKIQSTIDSIPAIITSQVVQQVQTLHQAYDTKFHSQLTNWNQSNSTIQQQLQMLQGEYKKIAEDLPQHNEQHLKAIIDQTSQRVTKSLAEKIDELIVENRKLMNIPEVDTSEANLETTEKTAKKLIELLAVGARSYAKHHEAVVQIEKNGWVKHEWEQLLEQHLEQLREITGDRLLSLESSMNPLDEVRERTNKLLVRATNTANNAVREKYQELANICPIEQWPVKLREKLEDEGIYKHPEYREGYQFECSAAYPRLELKGFIDKPHNNGVFQLVTSCYLDQQGEVIQKARAKLSN